MTDSKQYCLKWNNFSDNILTSLESLRGDEDFVDVTIACQGESLKAHKVVLSACSLYIKKLLKENPCAHPIIILKDVALTELRALLSFMYNGQVMVAEDQIPKLLRTAELLEIRGLADLTSVSEPPAATNGVATVVEHHPSSPKVELADHQQQEWGGSDEDEEYDDDDDEDDVITDFSISQEQKNNRDLQVTTVDSIHFSRTQQIKEEKTSQSNIIPQHTNIDCQDLVTPSRAMLQTPGQRAADLAARVSQMEDSLLPGDVLVIGETHITPARCVPRPLKPPPNIEQPPPPKQQCFDSQAAGDSRISLEMSLRLQVQRKLEAERLRAMDRLRHVEAAAFNDSPMDCSPLFPVLTNGVHTQENGHAHRDSAELLTAQQPTAPPAPAPAPTIPLPLSPDLQLKMLMCRDFKKYTNMLLVAVFGREVLATHCLNGSKGSAKPRLDTDKVTRVIATVMEKFDVPASTVREAIRVKLNNEDKLKKRSKRATNPLL